MKRKRVPNLPTLGDILQLDIKVEWVVDKLIPKQSVTVLHGKGGVGKTWLMLQMGSCVADEIPFVGLLPAIKMEAYYVDFENSLPVLHQRATVLGKSGLKVWHVSNPKPPPRLDSKGWEQYNELTPGLLIFDTFRASQSLDENSSKDMALIMMRLKELRDMGFTIALIHHSPKGNERTYRGSSAIVDQCDHVLSLERVKDVGSGQETDGEDWKLPLRLGVRGKTRYEPFSIYLQFDPAIGFEKATAPDEEPLAAVHDLIVNFERKKRAFPNQTQIAEMVKGLAINKKRLLRLLKKGEGQCWTVIADPHSKAKLYEPIIPRTIDPLFHSMDRKQWVNGSMETARPMTE